MIDSLRPTGVEKFVDIKIDVDRSESPILADPTEILQIVRNLVANASHALEKAKRKGLKLRLTSNETGFILKVEDEGSGMPKEAMDSVFLSFSTTKSEGW